MSSACPRLGFEMVADLAPALTDEARHALLAEMMRALVPRGLMCSVTGTQRLLIVVWHEAGQAESMDRDMMLEWARGRAEVVRADAGPIVDLRDDG